MYFSLHVLLSPALVTREAKQLSTRKQEIHSLSCVVLLKKQTAVRHLIIAFYFAL